MRSATRPIEDQDRLAAVVDHAEMVVWVVDREGRLTVRPSRPEFLGPGHRKERRRALAGETVRRQVHLADGDLWFDVFHAPVRDEHGAVTGAMGVAVDITGWRRATTDLARSELQYRQLVDTSRDIIWSTDAEGRLTFVNDAVRGVFGYAPEALVGRAAAELVAAGRSDAYVSAAQSLLAGRDLRNCEMHHETADGRPVVVLVNAVPLLDEDGRVTGATGTAADVTELKRYEARLRHLAEHDPLTGLLTRRRFEGELDREVARQAREGGDAAVLLLGLDDFKYVNDTLGHNLGDDALRSVARLLTGRLRRTDVLARLGGDELAALLPSTSAEHAQAVAEGLVAALREHPVPGSSNIRPTASVGVTMLGRREVTARELLGEADAAMYRAKELGRDRVARYVPGSQDAMRRTFSWVERIREALAQDAFELEFQPILDVRSGEISRYEALVRMRDGDRLIPPSAFLPAAERFGLIEAIDRWVVDRAVAFLAGRERRGEPVTLEVNLSGRSFGAPGTIEKIEDAIRGSTIDPSHLVFEITETAAIASLDEASSFARRLTALGCRFALDDFGTGFGSFHYLKYMPIHYIKLDGDFVRELPSSRRDQVLVRAIADVARGLGMSTIAEFVENDSILGKVREYGIDFAQGFHVGRPGALAA